MSKNLRVYELGRHYGVDSKQIIALLEKMKVEVKSHMSVVEEGNVDRIHAVFQRKREQARENYAKAHGLNPDQLKNVAALKPLERPQPEEEPEKPKKKTAKKKTTKKKAPAKPKVVVIKKAGTMTKVAKEAQAKKDAEEAAAAAEEARLREEKERQDDDLARKREDHARARIVKGAAKLVKKTDAPEAAAETDEQPTEQPTEAAVEPAPAADDTATGAEAAPPMFAAEAIADVWTSILNSFAAPRMNAPWMKIQRYAARTNQPTWPRSVSAMFARAPMEATNT